MPSVLDRARAYVAAGFSVCPIRADGSKAPAVAWKAYQQRRAAEAELYLWFWGGQHGLAIVCGAVSRNLEVIDFDDFVTFQRWAARIGGSVLQRYPIIATPAGGRHVYCRLPRPPQGNRKLACAATGKTLIETRGEGGYVLAPGCPGWCHPSGREYVQVSGPDLLDMGHVTECAR